MIADTRSKLDASVAWIEEQISKKEANDTLLRGYLLISSTFVRALESTELDSISNDLIKLLTRATNVS